MGSKPNKLQVIEKGEQIEQVEQVEQGNPPAPPSGPTNPHAVALTALTDAVDLLLQPFYQDGKERAAPFRSRSGLDVARRMAEQAIRAQCPDIPANVARTLLAGRLPAGETGRDIGADIAALYTVAQQYSPYHNREHKAEKVYSAGVLTVTRTVDRFRRSGIAHRFDKAVSTAKEHGKALQALDEQVTALRATSILRR